jgi:hypothetical protein
MDKPADGPSSTGIDFGSGNQFGDLTVSGTVVGRDLYQGPTPADAAAVEDRRQLLAVLDQVHAALEQLKEASTGDREDAQDELRKAKQAVEQGDTDRLTSKLQGLQSILERVGANLPAALALAQTVGVLVQKAAGLA